MANDIDVETGPVDWQRSFWALVSSLLTGGSPLGLAFHSSEDLSAWVQSVQDYGDPRVAAQLRAVLNQTRHPLVQNLMG